jgi:hypothetical protein
MIVTNKYLYNLAGKKLNLKRKINVALIQGITKSKTTHEFVIHCPQEYDYRYASGNLDKIVEIFCKLKQALLQTPFYIWEVNDS